jgi:aspartate/glutamate racemase
MSPAKKMTIGVLGGMGPEATSLFFELIVKNTLARRDQDHLPLIVCNLPQVPDRTPAILGSGPSPLPVLLRGLELLHGAGAGLAVMPCVSAHYFYPGLAARSLPLHGNLPGHPRERRAGQIVAQQADQDIVLDSTFR